MAMKTILLAEASILTVMAVIDWQTVVLTLVGFLVALGAWLGKDLWERVKIIETTFQKKSDCRCPSLETMQRADHVTSIAMMDKMLTKEDFREYKADAKETLKRLEEKMDAGFAELRVKP